MKSLFIWWLTSFRLRPELLLLWLPFPLSGSSQRVCFLLCIVWIGSPNCSKISTLYLMHSSRNQNIQNSGALQINRPKDYLFLSAGVPLYSHFICIYIFVYFSIVLNIVQHRYITGWWDDPKSLCYDHQLLISSATLLRIPVFCCCCLFFLITW